MTLYIEDKVLTNFMRAADLFHEKKVLCLICEEQMPQEASLTPELQKAIADKLLVTSHKEHERWRLVAVRVGSCLVCLDTVTEISDGQRSMFIHHEPSTGVSI